MSDIAICEACEERVDVDDMHDADICANCHDDDIYNCGDCAGSGEGMADGTTCGVCKGQGEVYVSPLA